MAADRVVLEMHEWAGAGFRLFASLRTGRVLSLLALQPSLWQPLAAGVTLCQTLPSPRSAKALNLNNNHPSKRNKESLKIFPKSFQIARMLVQMYC